MRVWARRVAHLRTLFVLYTCACGFVSGPRTAAASLPGTWQRVLTHIQATAMAAGDSNARLLEAGPGDSWGSSSWFYALVDTQRRRVLARGALSGGVNAVVMDEKRSRGYLVGSAAPLQATSQSFLWTVDLRTGRLLDHQAFAESSPGSLVTVAMDPRTGFLIMALGQGPVCCWTTGWGTLIILNPQTLWMRRTPLVAQPTWMSVDSAAGRIVVELAVPAPSSSAQLTTVVEGVDSRTGAVAWTRPFSYVVPGITASPRTHQVWLLAPGGLITRLASRQGATLGTLPVATGTTAPPRYGGLFIDPVREIAYIVRYDTASYQTQCGIERAQARSGVHRTMIVQFGSSTCANLVGLDPATGIIVTTQGTVVQTIDPRTTPAASRQLGVQGDQISAPTPVVLTTPAHQHTVAVFVGAVPDYNQETGGTTAAGLVFVPIAL